LPVASTVIAVIAGWTTATVRTHQAVDTAQSATAHQIAHAMCSDGTAA
jgi:hypothetical protein